MSWASNHDASLDKLRRVQGSLTVGLMMVPRADFLTCSLSQSAAEVKARNEYKYSFLPVVDDGDRVIGLYNAEQWFASEPQDEMVGADYLALSEDTVIGADASIFDFIRNADEVSTKLVVSGEGVAGLVSLSDIQQLPVRAALFALVTSLKMAMSLAIERRWERPTDWMALLSESGKEGLLTKIENAKQRDGFVSEIAFTEFSQKSTILIKGGLLSGSRSSHDARFKPIRKLRDDLAHANSYADTPEAAKSVCRVVRCIYHIKDQLLLRPSADKLGEGSSEMLM
jgi:hypothetical protein